MATVISWLRGPNYIYGEHSLADEAGFGLFEVGEVAAGEVAAGYVEESTSSILGPDANA